MRANHRQCAEDAISDESVTTEGQERGANPRGTGVTIKQLSIKPWRNSSALSRELIKHDQTSMGSSLAASRMTFQCSNVLDANRLKDPSTSLGAEVRLALRMFPGVVCRNNLKFTVCPDSRH